MAEKAIPEKKTPELAYLPQQPVSQPDNGDALEIPDEWSGLEPS